MTSTTNMSVDENKDRVISPSDNIKEANTIEAISQQIHPSELNKQTTISIIDTTKEIAGSSELDMKEDVFTDTTKE